MGSPCSVRDIGEKLQMGPKPFGDIAVRQLPWWLSFEGVVTAATEDFVTAEDILLLTVQ